MLVMKNFKLLKKNKDGVTAIEFAILAPVFFLLFLGIIEVGLTIFVDSSMNTAIREVSRQGISQELDRDEVDAIFRKHLAGLYNPGKIEYVNPAAALNPEDPSEEIDDLQEFSRVFRDGDGGRDRFFSTYRYSSDDLSGRLVVYVARYEWGGFSNLVSPFLPDYVYAVSIVRNEEYDDAFLP